MTIHATRSVKIKIRSMCSTSIVYYITVLNTISINHCLNLLYIPSCMCVHRYFSLLYAWQFYQSSVLVFEIIMISDLHVCVCGP